MAGFLNFCIAALLVSGLVAAGQEKRASGIVEGRVCWLDGTEISGSEVTAEEETNGVVRTKARTKSDSEGHFELSGLTSRLFYIRVIQPSARSYREQIVLRPEGRIVLSIGLAYAIYGDTRVSLQGRVVDDNGEPVRGARVVGSYYYLGNPEDREALEIDPALTGKDGTF